MRVEVELNWGAAWPVTRDASGQLKFPPGLHPVPAIYWFHFTGDGVARHYVGEAEDLVRRITGYRAGREKQKTKAPPTAGCTSTSMLANRLRCRPLRWAR